MTYLVARILKRVIKGWYISFNPDLAKGDTTSWYTSFWDFSAVYLNSRFGDKWSLSPEQSLLLHSGNRVIPRQLLIRSPKAKNSITHLLFDTSYLEIELKLPNESFFDDKYGLRIYSIPSGLIFCAPDFYIRNKEEVITCLASLKDTSEILRLLLDGGKTVVAGRIAGAFRSIGKVDFADEIMETMKSAGYKIRETNPFESKLNLDLPEYLNSPFTIRIKLLWDKMRMDINNELSYDDRQKENVEIFLKKVEDIYTADAYHSLSIEGYRVSEDLIEKIRKGQWDPRNNKEDKDQKDALAARGYRQCFQKVKISIERVFEGVNSGKVFKEDLSIWYRELFGPSVDVGILKSSDLVGYRNSQVYIAGSKYVPPSKEDMRNAMPVLFELLIEEKNAFVRAVLGHFFFVYIHPYMDGNGRIARFLMNLMLASGGYPWIIVKVDDRKTYMEALEEASVNNDITIFAKFISGLIDENEK